MSKQSVLYVTILSAIEQLVDEGAIPSSENLKVLLQWQTVHTQQFSDRAGKCVGQGYVTATDNKNRVNRSDTKIYSLTKKGRDFLDSNRLQVQAYGEYNVTDVESDLFKQQPLNPVDRIIQENKSLINNLKAIRVQLMKAMEID